MLIGSNAWLGGQPVRIISIHATVKDDTLVWIQSGRFLHLVYASQLSLVP